MPAPAGIWRKYHLYSVLPELEEIDIKIGPRFRPLDDNVFSGIKTRFQTELSNVVANGGDLLNFYTRNPSSLVYIVALEDQIMMSNCASGEELLNLCQQKISLLESAYSNIVSQQ